MKKLSLFLSLLLLVVLNACNPKITTSLSKSYPPLDYKQDVVVLGIDEEEPEGAIELGDVKVGDSGFSTNCGYDVVIDKAKLAARKAGGNAIKIIEHKLPSMLGSSCHRITAKILRIKDINELNSLKIKKTQSEPTLNVDYAILNIYRYGGAGALINYDLHLGDSVICRVRNNYKTIIHISKEGLNTLWAKTEAKAEVPIDFVHGKEYYLKCGVTMGIMVGHPSLELVDRKMGKTEFESFKAKHQ